MRFLNSPDLRFRIENYFRHRFPPCSFKQVTAPEYSLVLVSHPKINQWWDFELLARKVRELAPEIQTLHLYDQNAHREKISKACEVPTFVFSPSEIYNLKFPRGHVTQGRIMPKSEEYKRLDAQGIPVPEWTLLTKDSIPDLDGFEEYVVVKPDMGARGADVKIMKRNRVRWRQPKTGFVKGKYKNIEDCAWIVQKFIPTGPWPISHRVTTCYGEPVWAWIAESGRHRIPDNVDRSANTKELYSGRSIVSSGRGATFRLLENEEMFSLARQAHSVFPEIPLLGVDIVQDERTKKLYILEVNPGGYTWHLTSEIGRGVKREFGIDISRQFGAHDIAAKQLVRQVRTFAR